MQAVMHKIIPVGREWYEKARMQQATATTADVIKVRIRLESAMDDANDSNSPQGV